MKIILTLLLLIPSLSWGWGRVFSTRNDFAYQNTLDIFRENIKKYLIN